MLKFYYNKKLKYTNRTIIDVSNETNFSQKDYENIDTVDEINGHIIYSLSGGEEVPSYIVDEDSGKRWFVSGITQLRTGKYQISLLRDIISEHPELWKTEQAYVSAGTATDFNKYKRWDLPFTNTKMSEQRLNINGKSSFFVYYVNTQNIQNGVISEEDLKISSTSVPGVTGFDYEVTNLNEIPNFNLVDAGKVSTWEASKATLHLSDSIERNYLYFLTATCRDLIYDNSQSAGNQSKLVEVPQNSDNIGIKDIQWALLAANEYNSLTNTVEALKNFLSTYEANNFGTIIPKAQAASLDAYVNKFIYNSTNQKVYTIRKNEEIINNNKKLGTTEAGTFYSAISNIKYPIQSVAVAGQTDDFGKWLTFQSVQKVHEYTLVELGVATKFDFTFKANVRKLPKSAVRCVNIASGGGISDEDLAQVLMLAQVNGINQTGDTGRILDIQYLPFTIASETSSDIKINETAMTAQFLSTDDYSYETVLDSLSNINKETDTVKIVSPSRASQFLFRPYNNDGEMKFSTKITLKPYASVIYVRPSTKGLLLNNFDDKDCLTINEDFSLTNVSNEWANYIYNNRNYQNAFERQIQGREFERGWERRVEQAQAKSDEWNSRNISAEKARTYTGNLPIISGIAGAIGTAWQDENYMRAAQLDREYNEALYQQGLQLSRDLFNMQLENIQAQPNIPSKVTTIDCKFLDGVYLEFYSTNDTEKRAIENFYIYNGNRIDQYSNFGTYWGKFVRGRIIQAKNYNQPEVDELNRRLEMGIYTEEIKL